MVLVILEGCNAQIYFFNGVPRVSWNYSNEQLSLDRVAHACQDGPPVTQVININEESQLPAVLRREFAHCDMNVQKLWHLDPTAWDYAMMEALHRDDVGIRISFM
jgi:hypothetical protein